MIAIEGAPQIRAPLREATSIARSRAASAEGDVSEVHTFGVCQATGRIKKSEPEFNSHQTRHRVCMQSSSFISSGRRRLVEPCEHTNRCNMQSNIFILEVTTLNTRILRSAPYCVSRTTLTAVMSSGERTIPSVQTPWRRRSSRHNVPFVSSPRRPM